jgi:hypothetical protein
MGKEIAAYYSIFRSYLLRATRRRKTKRAKHKTAHYAPRAAVLPIALTARSAGRRRKCPLVEGGAARAFVLAPFVSAGAAVIPKAEVREFPIGGIRRCPLCSMYCAKSNKRQ